MYLKALEIQGFKSFPDKTVLNFGEDITAIVGPNGSGKSNISDAILWVMGEQSSKQLRGAKMEDVIFGGTETRNQMGFAQVTLVIDNSEHIFNRDEIEVAVTRRFYRSGESEYYINKQACRLKDVTELFMDTGMGREGYSIIGQGKVDEILSVKSGERREIFEEAAGIAKFRHRKEDAEKKLEHTEENLLRINDKIAELEMQVGPLKEQSEVAKKYLVFRDELRLLEISVWLEQLQDVKTKRSKLLVDIENAKIEKETAEKQQNACYDEIEQYGTQIRNVEMTIEEKRSELASFEDNVNQESNAITVLEASIRNETENISRLEKEKTDSELRADGLKTQIQEKETRLTEIEEVIAQIEKNVQDLLQQAKDLSESMEGNAKETESLRARQAQLVAEAADMRSQVSSLHTDSDITRERSEKAEADLLAKKDEYANNQRDSKANDVLLEEAKEEVQSIQNTIEGYDLKMQKRRQKAQETENQKLHLTLDVGTMKDRIELLKEMEKDYEGFSKAVKEVMQATSYKALHGIRGPIASLMHTQSKYNVAIEIALGAGLQNIVVDREEDAKAAINYLKQKDGGRATFSPISAIHGDILNRDLSKEAGFVGIASNLIEYDADYDSIFKNLLGRTVIVEDLDYGIAMSKKYRNEFRIVTLDGQVLNRGGSMTGGSVNKKSGVLSRASELKSLEAKLGTLAEKLSAATAEANEANRELQSAQYELDVAQSKSHDAEEKLLTYQGKQEHYQILSDTLSSAISDLEADISDFALRLQDNDRNIKNLEAAILQKAQDSDACSKQLQTLLEGQVDVSGQNDQLMESVSRKKQEQAALNAEKDSIEKNIEEFKLLFSQEGTVLGEKSELQQQFQENIQKYKQDIEEHKIRAEQLRAENKDAKDAMDQLSSKKLELEGLREKKNLEVREMNDTRVNASTAFTKINEKYEANLQEETVIIDKLWEKYELSFTDANAQRIEIESVSKANRRIMELNKSMKDLGTPNLGAIEEYERVNTRYTYLTEQRTDVETSKDELLGIIEEITSKMTVIFKEQFALIDESFRETFVELFGGGKAHLELEDENDVLNCGIEIKVQPPGKQLKTLSLLSGGEKAFVAIALYFSILKVHPTPFCVMDEIEAALDEANVIRCAKYMRNICNKTQFLVITHRRGTMEEADVLYGVTMQERGVSKVLTVNLNDVAKENNIK